MAYPNCRAYDPAFAYEVAVIVRDGIRRMYGPDPEDCFYYLTLYNENYRAARDARRRRGGHRARAVPLPRRAPSERDAPRADPRERPDGAAGARSAATARRAPRRRGRRVERHRAGSSCVTRRSTVSAGTGCTRPRRRARPYVTQQLGDAEGPVVAVSDWVKAVPDSIARFVPQPYVVLGTDGYGFSDTRAALRRHFEVDAAHIVVAVLDGAGADRRRQGRGRGRSASGATRSTPRRPSPRLTLSRAVNCAGGRGPSLLLLRPGRRPDSSSSTSSSSSDSSDDVRQRAGAFPEQAVVVALLELARLAETASSSFSGHVVTCLGVCESPCQLVTCRALFRGLSAPIMPCRPRSRRVAGPPSYRAPRPGRTRRGLQPPDARRRHSAR